MKKFGVILLMIVHPALASGGQSEVQERLQRTIQSNNGDERPTEAGGSTYEIGFLVDEMVPEMLPLFVELRNEIVAVVGRDATIRFREDGLLSNELDHATAARQYQALLNDETDIIIAFGRVNSEVISGQSEYPKPTILFGAVNSDLVEIAEDADTSGVDNYTYLVTSQSYRRDLATLKGLFDFRHIGIIVDGNESVRESVRQIVGPATEELGATYTFIAYESPEDVSAKLGSVDAVYLAEGFLIPDNEIRALAELFIDAGLPSFTSNPLEDVEAGLMATNQAEENLGQFFRRIALDVEAVVNGENLSQRPIFIEAGDRLSINYATAERVNVSLKYSSLATTNIVGDFDNIQADKTYTLVEVIEGAIANNLSLAASRQDILLAEQDVKSAKSNYLPSVSASATGAYIDPALAEISNGQNPEYSASGNVSLSQTLFSNGANANISIRKNLLDADREDFNSKEFDLILDASNAYFNVLILKANARIRKENLDLTKRNLAIAEQNFEAGQTGRADFLRFRSEFAQNMQALVEAINRLDQGFYGLNQLLNNPIDKRINVTDARLGDGALAQYDYTIMQTFLDDPVLRKPFVEFLSAVAIENAPELKALDYNIEVTERNITLNGVRRFIPTVAAQANYNRTFDQWGVGSLPSESILKDNYNVGVSVSVPLFDQNRESISRQTAIIQKQQLQINRDNLALSIDANVKSAVSDLSSQISNIELSKVSEETASQSLELSQTSYSSGAINLVQLLDAQNNYLQAQLSRVNANYNYLISAIILNRYVGYYFLLHSEAENNAFRQRFFEYMLDNEDSE